jgi:hypothetical protein
VSHFIIGQLVVLLARQSVYKTNVMNRILTLLGCLSFFAFPSTAQQITSIEVFPSNPSSLDTVYVYITSTFPSGSCDGVVEFGLLDNNIYTSALHCLGLFTVICTDTDTVKLNPMEPGLYTVTHTLSSGYGPPNECSPGIVADDVQSVSFTVSPFTGEEESDKVNFLIYPNPGADYFTVQMDELHYGNWELEILDAFGNSIRTIQSITSSILRLDVSAYPAGIYFIRLNNKGKEEVLLRKFVIE